MKAQGLLNYFPGEVNISVCQSKR